MKDLKELKYFLEIIEINYSKQCFSISQRNYVFNRLQEIGNLKASPEIIVLFKRGENLIREAYIDIDYAGSTRDKGFTSGYCTFLCEKIVAQWSRKLSVIGRSRAKAEFRAKGQGICELLWMKKVTEDLMI